MSSFNGNDLVISTVHSSRLHSFFKLPFKMNMKKNGHGNIPCHLQEIKLYLQYD